MNFVQNSVQTFGGFTDSYNPITGEIVSRKDTQLAWVQERTAFRYLGELARKYPTGAVIANVKSNRRMPGLEVGGQLRGQMILEVPVQEATVPARIIDRADALGTQIRDDTGRVYGH